MLELAKPLENYSSLHLLSLKSGWPMLSCYAQFDFNICTPFKMHPEAFFAEKAVEANSPVDPASCLSLTGLTRWRTNISSFSSFEDYLNKLARWHRCNYVKSKRLFEKYGASVRWIEDWSEHAEAVYRLYANVAKQYQGKLYDLNFFRETAKRPDYPLIGAWFEGELIGHFVLQRESSVLHSTCCGMDYNHSSKCYLYSWLHYELIRIAIEAKNYTIIDVGMSANESKKTIGFTPVPVRLDVYIRNPIAHRAIKFFSKFLKASINENQKIKIHL